MPTDYDLPDPQPGEDDDDRFATPAERSRRGLPAHFIKHTAALSDGDTRDYVTEEVTSAQGTAGSGGASAWFTQDDYVGGQCLPDQTGDGAVLTFTFSLPVNLVVVHSNGTDLVSRCDPFGGTPSDTQGFICGDDIPVYLPITCTTVKVFAPASAVVSVAGFRRA